MGMGTWIDRLSASALWAAAFAAGLLLGPEARAERQCRQDLCLVTGELEGKVVFSLTNDFPVPAHVELEFTDLRNLEPDHPEPKRLVAPGSAEPLAVLRPRDEAASYRYRFQWSYVLGDPEARHDEAVRYRMPFGGGAARKLAPGPLGAVRFQGDHALDIEMPAGTPVLAAREGVVLQVVDEFEEGGRSTALAAKANQVVVLHPDGTMARYLHLQKGAAVAPGEAVAAGARLGASGDTGYTVAPHLHFDVVRATPGGGLDSVAIRFAGSEPEGFAPERGRSYPPQARP